MRIARDFGTVAELLPDGIDDVRDAPHPVFDAIRAATVVLSFDELPRKERPPRRIWLDGEALKAHFEDVERNRKRDDEHGEIEDAVQNAAAKDLIVG